MLCAFERSLRLLSLGEKLFSELTQRALAELAKTTRDAHERPGPELAHGLLGFVFACLS